MRMHAASSWPRDSLPLVLIKYQMTCDYPTHYALMMGLVCIWCKQLVTVMFFLTESLYGSKCNAIYVAIYFKLWNIPCSRYSVWGSLSAYHRFLPSSNICEYYISKPFNSQIVIRMILLKIIHVQHVQWHLSGILNDRLDLGSKDTMFKRMFNLVKL